MKHALLKAWTVPFLVGLCLALSGCIEKTVYPSVLITVTSVEPYQLVPLSSGTIDLPTCVVNVRCDTQTPAKLVSYSITYATKLGEPLPHLAVIETAMEKWLTVGGETALTFSPLTAKVQEFFELTDSDISPLKATITMTITDANRNTIRKEAHCLLLRAGTA